MKHPYGRKCLFINGPAGAGKSTMAFVLRRKFGAIEYVMAAPLKNAIRELLTIDPDQWRKIMENPETKNTKNYLSQYGYRDLICKLHTEWVVPTLGEAFLGKLAAMKLLTATQATSLYTISGAGVACEYPPIIEVFGVENCAIVNIEREGCEYVDYRSDIDGSALGIASTTVVNQFDMELYEQQCVNVVKKLWPSLVKDD